MVEDMYFVQYLHRFSDNYLYGLHYGVITVKLDVAKGTSLDQI